MTDAGAVGLGRPPRRDAPVEQVERERPADPPLAEGVDGPPRPAPRHTPDADAPGGRRGDPATRLRALLASPGGLRQAVLAAEVFGRPAAVRRARRARRR